MVSLSAQCAELIKESDFIVALTGAGISTSAGIPDFRGPRGLYVTRQYDPDRVFDINSFYRDPKPFFDFARDFVGLEERIQPTFTHRFLAELEEAGKLQGIITQNIDSLHQRAGSKKVYEMHGSFWKNFCLSCQEEFDYSEIKQRIPREKVPECVCGGVIKPDIVFFGENVKCFSESAALAEQADLFLIIGTSCVVHPAASLPSMVSGRIVIVNQTPVNLPLFNVVLTSSNDIDAFFQEVNNFLKKDL
ncbi:MAG: Sir2 family NAD-dependent protein deacetylase [Candidatus Omnitrophica bacterium]|nr:Sir2 family NAD-dependent protein deacetylase [Candidatus Omnitrophota bacterium]